MEGIGKGIVTIFSTLFVVALLIYFTISIFFKSYVTLPKDIEEIRHRVEKIEKEVDRLNQFKK